MIFDGLKKLQSKGVKLQVAVNAPQTSAADTEELAAQGRSCRQATCDRWATSKLFYTLGL